MKRFRNIVVSGDIGTGTSTLTLSLAKKLDWDYLSAGDIFRKYFKENNIPLWKKSAIPDDFDKKVDYDFFEKMKTEKNLVVDSHYGGWFAKNLDYTFKILLTTDKEISSKRIIEREHTHNETLEDIEKRRQQLKKKFKKLYSNDDYEDPKIFDLVIDTTTTGKNETLQIAYEVLEKGY